MEEKGSVCGGRGETGSIVAGNTRVIWDHPGSSGVGGGYVYVRLCTCVSWGLGAGRHRETSALDPRAGLECMYMRGC